MIVPNIFYRIGKFNTKDKPMTKIMSLSTLIFITLLLSNDLVISITQIRKFQVNINLKL